MWHEGSMEGMVCRIPFSPGWRRQNSANGKAINQANLTGIESAVRTHSKLLDVGSEKKVRIHGV